MNSVFGFVIALVLLISRLWYLGRRERGLPPGPPTTIILGNAIDFPKEFPYIRFTQWAAQYGDIFSLKVFHRTLVILNSAAAVKGILDKQGLVTGNRPRSIIFSRSQGQPYAALHSMDTSVWKTSRKAFHTFLNPEALERYWPVQQAAYEQLIRNILHSPAELYTHIRLVTASVMISLVYGKQVSRFEGSKAKLYWKGHRLLSYVSDTLAHPPVDLIPILEYIPSRWAKWKIVADQARALRDEFDVDLFADCEEAVRSGNRMGCYIEDVLENQAQLDMSREEVRGMGKVLMDGGTNTTASYLHSFIVALISYPSCQAKAQEEVDRVIGDDRLPTLDDFNDLPYVRALVKEVHRFRPVFPTALPHEAAQDVQYSGYIIPKGSIIFMNVWGILRDPKIFEEPDSFMPERYLRSEHGAREGADIDGLRDTIPFGAGRRICPGMEMATRTIIMNTMNLLWAFNFAQDKSDPCSIQLDNYPTGLDLSPRPFTCDVKVRNEKRAALIKGLSMD